MKLDISPAEFEALSLTKKKLYIAQLFIRQSGALPVLPGETPIAYIMAGLPGAGKTEFLDSIVEEQQAKGIKPFLRIDLDEIVSVYPKYSPKDYYKFRNQGNLVLAKTVDEGRHAKLNMLIDGTFSGMSGASVEGVSLLLKAGYNVKLVYMYDKADTAWYYTRKREVETGRYVELEGFKRAAIQLVENINNAYALYKNEPNFSISVVVQKELRDKSYNIMTEKSDVENAIQLSYNIDTIT